MEFALNFSLTAPYTDTSQGVIKAAWPIFRDLANMGLILVLVAIGIGTILNLKTNRNQLMPFIIIAFLINFTPMLTGIVIDLSNLTARIFFDAAQNASNAFLAGNPFSGSMDRLGGSIPLIGRGISGDAFGATDFSGISIFAIMTTIFLLVLIFAYLLLGALFLGRTLALWLLVIFSPIAFVAYILPSTRKVFDNWWNNFLKWSLIAIPLIFSLWLAGIFLHNTSVGCQAISQSAIEQNIGENLEENDGTITGESSLAGDDYATILYPVTAAQTNTGTNMICGITSMIFALGTLFVGISMSLKSSATGANIIISRAKKLKDAMMKKASKWAGTEAEKRGRQLTARPLSKAGQGLADSRLGRSALGSPLRNLGLAMQRPAVKWAQQYKEHEKKFQGMSWEQMKGMLFERTDKGSAAWAYAAKNHAGDLRKTLDDPKTGGGLRKVMKAKMKKANLRGDDSMKEVEKIDPKTAAETKHAGISDEGKRLDAIKNEIHKIVEKLDDKAVANLSNSSLGDTRVVKALEEQGKLTKGAIENLAKEETRLATLDTILQENYKKELVKELKKMTSEERIKTFGSVGSLIARGGDLSPEAYKKFLSSPENYKKMLRYKKDKSGGRVSPYLETIEAHPYAAAFHFTTKESVREGLTKKDFETFRKEMTSKEDKK
ncbi:MAG: hypothetical protein A3F94_02835 [Candidatus Spechtbacteria bacterium RIFCSPLOWO2_12_FULL_38_22]|uniref:Uncharacterized protein n=1 Tax=Candidatus Spechtbacteria bacterium RIFCSPLOWO2_12_FULL_38_22 TaxID=1802165 RepID=A0A1G2HK09_9BACT|nr:MAG: hypothetical protein A2728_01510 [Candidatus Spechtbacteria bacterium RIFCSPHIGHO2_01_FULL_38_11]OGZ60061.1 MAG: hypothetical protein A3E58_01825 [Candidatus Spechtbacteria bacterium RIFCSPHIGHO2_12_FULL_38_30]OGZ60937.1 MAG: hypothetical protein A3A00_02295 [Candidatus Spechtbacteria bacterium RIFCSPLOWO2_01_FULL_38_20]OGZ62238.1 MAG: hypothetical protein A3F94_02835 [Candidatus Spechtbacteria bacterium RIFCSPLOWO2_12_FULL_38_22]